MSTEYKMYINHNNDSKVFVVPVLPEEIEVRYKGEVSSSKVDMFGEVLHKGKREAAVISFSSFFPAEYSKTLCACKKGEFKTPDEWHEWLLKLEDEKKPCHFVLTGSPLSVNLYADITSYSGSEVGGDPGTIHYSLELKEHRDPTIKEIKVKSGSGKSGSGSKKSSKNGNGKTRTNNKEDSNTYKVTASALHIRSGPNQKVTGTMKKGTKITTDGKKKGNWLHVKCGNKWGWAYMDYLKEA